MNIRLLRPDWGRFLIHVNFILLSKGVIEENCILEENS